MNRHDNISDPMLRAALAARAVRMSASTLRASERAARLSALMADKQPSAPQVMSPHRHHRLLVVASIAASVAVVIAIVGGLLRAPAESGIPLPAPVASTLPMPQPVEGAMVAVVAPPAPAKAPVKRKSRRRSVSEPVSRHDRILAEIISAETDETRSKQEAFDDTYHRIADLINSSLAMIERFESLGAEYQYYSSPVILSSDNEQ